MSLPALADHLASQGRYGDTNLVHMSDHEVNQLQHFMQAQGKSLTINPHTGLPEAFLGLGKLFSSMGPVGQTLAGAALTILTDGAINPMMAGGIVGAATGLATGNLMQGVTAGLGAWGGGAVGEGFMGASKLASTGDKALAAKAAAAEARAVPGAAPLDQAGFDKISSIPKDGAFNFGSAAPAQIQPYVAPSAAGQMAAGANRAATGIGNLIGGGEAGTSARENFWKAYKIPILATGASLLLGASNHANNPAGQGSTWQNQIIAPNTNSFDPNYRAHRVGENTSYRAPWDTTERSYFSAKEGGLMSLAEGGSAVGPVEAMSEGNEVGQNTHYPMANQMTSSYSPIQASNPIAQDLIRPQGEDNVDPYTGEEKFAAGGQAGEMLRNLSGMYGNAMHSN